MIDRIKDISATSFVDKAQNLTGYYCLLKAGDTCWVEITAKAYKLNKRHHLQPTAPSDSYRTLSLLQMTELLQNVLS